MAPLPPGVTGHLGPELRRFVLAQSHQGQVTVPRLVAQLRAIGVSISQRQVMRLLITGQDAFHTEARDVLRAGLQTAGWITVDDTAARHKAINGFCTLLVVPNQVWGSIQAHGFLHDAVIVSDDAGQFAVGRRALCWIHAERLVHKLDTFTDHQRAAQQRVRALRRLTALLGISPLRGLIGQFYADLKDYRSCPTPCRRGQLRARFDYIF